LLDEKRSKVREAMQALPLQMQTCLRLRIEQELAYDEIADVMQLSVNTVKSHLHQGRMILREKLGPYFNDVAI